MTDLTEKMRKLAEAKEAADAARARVLSDIGGRLQAAREAKGYNQAFVAELCGVSRPQISNIESGRYGMTVDCLMTMCSLYEVSADFILGLEPVAAQRVHSRPTFDFSLGPRLKEGSQP